MKEVKSRMIPRLYLSSRVKGGSIYYYGENWKGNRCAEDIKKLFSYIKFGIPMGLLNGEGSYLFESGEKLADLGVFST